MKKMTAQKIEIYLNRSDMLWTASLVNYSEDGEYLGIEKVLHESKELHLTENAIDRINQTIGLEIVLHSCDPWDI